MHATPTALQARLDAVLLENRRLRAETSRIVAESRAWSDAVARNIQEAPRWVWNEAPDPVDAQARWPLRQSGQREFIEVECVRPNPRV